VSERWTPFSVEDADADPFAQFATWFDQGAAHLSEPDAVVFATADGEGRPHARWVLLRHRGRDGYGVFTNYDSRKARELRASPFAAIVWHDAVLGRQVRVEGPCRVMSDVDSDAYFASRPRGHQIAAWASHQSQPVQRDELAARVHELDDQFGDEVVPRPPFWGGFLVVPDRFEFFQQRDDRLHDRVLYEPAIDGWSRQRLSP